MSEKQKTASDGKGDAKADDAAGAKAPKKAPPPAWQAEDYNGPLDCEQAAWRNAHFKPAQVQSTK